METYLLISSILLWVLMLFNILLTIGLARRISRQFPSLEFLKAGSSAPDFTAWTLEGEEIAQANYAGRAVAFVFISPHCQPCREEIPKLEALRPQAGRNGIELVLVSDADEEETRKFIEELGVPYPVLVAPRTRTTFLVDYKANATPLYCLVDAQGKVQAAGLSLSELGEKMESLSR
jgi:peroxiredoxin